MIIEQPAELEGHAFERRALGGCRSRSLAKWQSLPASSLAAALRHRPDRIIMGEIRDESGYDLLQAMNTGHGGTLSTIHAKSAQDALQPAI